LRDAVELSIYTTACDPFFVDFESRLKITNRATIGNSGQWAKGQKMALQLETGPSNGTIAAALKRLFPLEEAGRAAAG
jgi:hypothetical protein